MYMYMCKCIIIIVHTSVVFVCLSLVFLVEQSGI